LAAAAFGGNFNSRCASLACRPIHAAKAHAIHAQTTRRSYALFGLFAEQTRKLQAALNVGNRCIFPRRRA
jgi:hypothetical protein